MIPVAVGILPGRVLAGRYEIIAKLGHGGMGAVYRAHDRELGEDVALKVLLPDLIRDSSALERFRREVKFARKIAHPNVCRVFDVGEDGNTRFLTMEFIAGQSLRERLLAGPIEPSRALSILHQIIQGIAAAHGQGVIHRDLKPDNVMLRDSGQAVVADFGLARAPATNAAESNFAGTPAYMSPEQIRGETLDGRSDIFALGIVAYEVLVGRLPFQGKTIAEIATATLRDPPAPFEIPGLGESVQRGVKAAILRALEKKPEDRYTSVIEFGDALISAGAEHSAPTMSGPILPLEVRKPNKVYWPVIAGIVLASIIAIWLVKMRAFSPKIAEKAPPVTSAAAPKTRVMSSNDRADKLYQQALIAMHDGDESRAITEMEQAAALDPAFGAAQLRLAVWSLSSNPSQARTHQIAANRLRTSLDEHDTDFLQAMNAWLEQPPDIQAWGERVEALAKKYPDDVEALLLVAGVRLYQMRVDAATAVIHRALELDASNAVAWAMKADVLALQGDVNGQLEAYGACLSKMPTATKCLTERTRLRGHMRECSLMKEDAKALLMLKPDAAATHELLATALESTGEARESVVRALEKSFSLRPEEGRFSVESKARAALAIRDGDFESGARWLEKQLAKNVNEIHQDSHAFPALQLALLQHEMGEMKQAHKTISTFLSRKEAWIEDLDNDWVMLFSCVDWHAGGMTSAAFAKQRDRWVERFRTKWKNSGRKDNEELQWLIWDLAFGCPVETKDEALEALKNMPQSKSPLVALGRLGSDFFEGKVYTLVGDFGKAIPLLRRAANTCYVLDEALMPQRATYYLGLALQGQGDDAGARQAYQSVINRWGKAKPRSITAERAAKALDKLSHGDKPFQKAGSSATSPFGTAIDTRR